MNGREGIVLSNAIGTMRLRGAGTAHLHSVGQTECVGLFSNPNPALNFRKIFTKPRHFRQ